MTDYSGIIIEESLESKDILHKVKIIKTDVEDVTEDHKTPWIEKWIMHTVEILEDQAQSVAEGLSSSLDSKHAWYADFKNDRFHYIIFSTKVFKVDRSQKEQYQDVTKYGLSLGIPGYQLDFSPHYKNWER